jgi:hypothetical protein
MDGKMYGCADVDWMDEWIEGWGDMRICRCADAERMNGNGDVRILIGWIEGWEDVQMCRC